jgi:endonuclease-3 related protein
MIGKLLLHKRLTVSSYDLWLALRNRGYLDDNAPPYWWPNIGTFEVLIGTILTQQSKWEKVELSLENLKSRDLVDLQRLANASIMIIEEAIKPSGFYRKKAKVLQRVSLAIVESFGDFETFTQEVNREWLLTQKGIGFESADSILCYACQRDVMVVDNYTNKLMKGLGYTFESYDELQAWLVQGIEENYDKISKYYADKRFFTIYSRFHGKIVEYMKVTRDVNLDNIVS